MLKDIIIAVAAFVGMGLGLYNLWNEKNKEKVKLRVVPKAVVHKGRNSVGQEMVLTSENEFDSKRSHGLFGIEVVNLSKFPVVIDNVGFLVKGEKNRMSLPIPILGDQGPWPRKLEARESVTVYGNLKDMISSPGMPKVHSAFAKTSCGHMGKGSTQALKQLVESSLKLHDNPDNADPKKRRSFLASLFGSGYGGR